jgi:hypothetical protein
MADAHYACKNYELQGTEGEKGKPINTREEAMSENTNLNNLDGMAAHLLDEKHELFEIFFKLMSRRDEYSDKLESDIMFLDRTLKAQ